MNNATITKAYARSVLRITCGGDRGTAYIVDMEGGYLLTAAHVVAKAIDGGLPIRIDLSDFRKPKYDVVIVAQLWKRQAPSFIPPTGPNGDAYVDSADLALLKVTPAELLKGRTALDVSDRTLPSSVPVFMLGFPGTDPKEKDEPEPRTGDAGASDSYEIQVWTKVNSGDSGAPVFDETGHVIGTCDTANYDVKAHVLSTALAVPLLLRIGLSSTAKELDGILRAGEEPFLSLAKRVNLLTNFELIQWSASIRQNLGAYPRAKAYKDCPIRRALEDRRLHGPMTWLQPWMPPGAVATAYREIARREQMTGATSMASEYYSRSQAFFQKAILARVRVKPDGIRDAVCRAGLSKSIVSASSEGGQPAVAFGKNRWLAIATSSQEPPFGDCTSAGGDEYLASLLRDYALASLERGRIERGRNRAALLAEAAGSAGLAAAASTNSARQGYAMTLAGDAAGLAGNEQGKINAYGAARESGYKPPWVMGALAKAPDSDTPAISIMDALTATKTPEGTIEVKSAIVKAEVGVAPRF